MSHGTCFPFFLIQSLSQILLLNHGVFSRPKCVIFSHCSSLLTKRCAKRSFEGAYVQHMLGFFAQQQFGKILVTLTYMASNFCLFYFINDHKRKGCRAGTLRIFHAVMSKVEIILHTSTAVDVFCGDSVYV